MNLVQNYPKKKKKIDTRFIDTHSPSSQNHLVGLRHLCYSSGWYCNGFIYTCETCIFELDIQYCLTLEIITHEGHEHQLLLSSTSNLQSCIACGARGNYVFQCTTCEFALDFICATLPLSTM